MPRAKLSFQQDTPENSQAPSPTTGGSTEKPFDPTRSKEEAKIYSEAAEQNREHDFIQAILEARKPPEVPVYVPPVPSPAAAEQTRLEMETGRKRVMEFASQEIERREAHERHKRDKWADKGSISVFRPDDYVPDQKKGQGNITATSVTLKE